jgi:TolA-binding protein
MPDHSPSTTASRHNTPKLRLCVLLLAAVCWQPALHAKPDKASDDFNLGVGFYRDQRWQLAADTFDEFVTEFPNHPRTNLARVYLGLALSSLEEYEKARTQFEMNLRAVPDGPNAADVRYRLGECSYYLQEYDVAINQLTEYLAKHAGHNLNDWARLFMGDAYNELQQFDQAETVLRDLLDSEPAAGVVSDAKFGLARALESQSNRAEAFPLYREVSQDEQSIFAPRALARIAAMYFSQQQYADAAMVYDDIIARFPKSPQARNALVNGGLALYRNEQFEDALTRFEGVTADSPLIAQAVVLKAMTLRELGRPEEARVAFNDALAAAGDSTLATDILFQKAQLERSENQPEDAARIFEDIADRWPDDKRVADCLFNAIDLRIKLGETDRAERLWTRLERDAADFADRPASQILKSRLLLATGESAAAAGILQTVIDGLADSSSRNAVVARYLMSRAQFDAQNYDETIAIADELLPLTEKPEFTDIRDVLVLAAVAATNSGNHAAARRFADRYLVAPASEPQRADALSARTVALAGLGEYDASITDAATLVADFAQREESWNAILTAANLAREAKAWDSAEQLFRVAARNEQNALMRESAMTGIAVSLYRAEKFEEAQIAFRDAIVASADPNNEAQLRYLLADSVAQAGRLAEAAGLFQDVFTRVTTQAASTGELDIDSAAVKYAYDAGKQAARLFEQADDIPGSDTAWQAVADTFSAADDADAVLDEWAHMNLMHERYARADEIHRQLLDRFPQSSFAGTARLSLAESAVLEGRTREAIEAFESILRESAFGEREQSSALYHLVDIAIAAGDWSTARQRATQFQESYPNHDLLPRVRLFLAEAELNAGDIEIAQQVAAELRTAVQESTINLGVLSERVWLILARAALEAARYEDVDTLAAEMKEQFPDSRFTFQMRDLQGRRWLLQAPPDFDKARDYFREVINDPHGRGSRTAANAQLRIADTLRRQSQLQEAVREYYRLYYNHTGNDDLRVEALYAAAVCERDLNETASAVRSLQDLVTRFPESPRRQDAVRELEAMGAEVPRTP